jgi:hypothetical protein
MMVVGGAEKLLLGDNQQSIQKYSLGEKKTPFFLTWHCLK